MRLEFLRCWFALALWLYSFRYLSVLICRTLIGAPVPVLWHQPFRAQDGLTSGARQIEIRVNQRARHVARIASIKPGVTRRTRVAALLVTRLDAHTLPVLGAV